MTRGWTDRNKYNSNYKLFKFYLKIILIFLISSHISYLASLLNSNNNHTNYEC